MYDAIYTHAHLPSKQHPPQTLHNGKITTRSWKMKMVMRGSFANACFALPRRIYDYVPACVKYVSARVRQCVSTGQAGLKRLYVQYG